MPANPLRHLVKFSCCVVLSAMLFGATSRGDEPTVAPLADEAHQRQLIQYLNDPSYQRREAAARDLSKLGDLARGVLTEALSHPEPEIRLAVQRILQDISRGDFEKALQALLQDESGSLDHQLPLWPEFREAIGSDAEARAMFVNMVRAESALMTEVNVRPRTAGGYFFNRCQELQQESYDQGREIDVAHIAAMIFIAADERVPLSSSANSLLTNFCHHQSVRSTLENDDAPSIMRKLVGRWVADGRGGNYALRMAMQYNLPEGLIAARKMLQGSDLGYYKQYAILAVAKLGDKKDASLLEDLLQDTTKCSSHRVDDVTYSSELRDVALVGIIHLAGKDPKDFGFDRIQKNEQYLYLPHSLGFASEETRQAAVAKWLAAQADDQDAG